MRFCAAMYSLSVSLRLVREPDDAEDWERADVCGCGEKGVGFVDGIDAVVVGTA
jgi:hypothetical protein